MFCLLETGCDGHASVRRDGHASVHDGHASIHDGHASIHDGHASMYMMAMHPFTMLRCRGNSYCDKLCFWSCVQQFEAKRGKCVSDITVSRGSYMVIPNDKASIVMALVSMYGECWPTKLPTVCNRELPIYEWIVKRSWTFKVLCL